MGEGTGSVNDKGVREQVARCIHEKLHVMVQRERGLTPQTWRYPVGIEDDVVILRDSDCGLVKPVIRWTFSEWRERVEWGGLWRQVGFWSFTPADDEAADCIRYCHQHPEAAGRELYARRKMEADHG